MIFAQVVEGHRAHRTSLTKTVEQVTLPTSTGIERGLLLSALGTHAVSIGLPYVEVISDLSTVESFPHFYKERKL